METSYKPVRRSVKCAEEGCEVIFYNARFQVLSSSVGRALSGGAILLISGNIRFPFAKSEKISS